MTAVGWSGRGLTHDNASEDCQTARTAASTTQQDSPAPAEHASTADRVQADGDMLLAAQAPAEPDCPAAQDQASSVPTVVLAAEPAASLHPASDAAMGLADLAASTPAAMASKPAGLHKLT